REVAPVRCPLTKQPSSVTVQVVSSPYWLFQSETQAGVSRPRRFPKSPGLVHTPQSCPLIHRVISDGQFSREPGASEHSSMEQLIFAIFSPAGTGLGNRYST